MIVLIIVGVLFLMFLTILLVTDAEKAINNKIDDVVNKMVAKATE